jgi:sugar/nucleoside kinase (ribokinase family)
MPAVPSALFDVLGIGNAIVDVLARADDDFLLAHDMRKGGMALIDETRAQAIYDARAAFIGKLKADELGRAFSHDIRAAGVTFSTPPASDGPSTGRCYVLVTPDGERTMNTYLGAAQDLHPSDVDEKMVAASAVTYLEGYLWDPKHAKEAFLKAAKVAHDSGRKVALSLSDAFCVDRWRDEFLQLMRSGTLDLVFANEAELHSLYQTSDFDGAIAALRADVGAAVVTRSEKGCLVLGPEGVEAVPAFPVERVVDTTGAGDLFAAGFLSALARGADDRSCGRLGALAAAEVIQHLGARPEISLRQLAQENGLAVGD